MAKFELKRLSRGVKLLTGHLHGQVSTALAALTNTGVEAGNLEKGSATFRVNLSIPVFPGVTSISSGTGDAKKYVQVPFVVPPLQEFWNRYGAETSESPEVVLEAVAFSCDQRGENAAISWTDKAGASDQGEIYKNVLDTYNIKLSILERQMQCFGNSSTDLDRVIYTLDLPGTISFGGEDLRFNPMVQSDLDLVLSPYKTYVMQIQADDLGSSTIAADAWVALSSILVSLQFRHPLVARDHGTTHITNNTQNLPLPGNGDLNTSPVTISTPAATAEIEADNASTGVNTIFEAIDNVFRNKMQGGYRRFSKRRAHERIKDNAAYEVIAVPLWGGYRFHDGGSTGAPSDNDTDWSFLPAPINMKTMSPQLDADAVVTDKRIIPLTYPMTIHHVVLAASYTRPELAVAGLRPTSTTFTNTVTVKLENGIRSDDASSITVAKAEWTQDPASKAQYLIDQIGADNTTEALWDILNCPLTYVTGITGEGYGSIVGPSTIDGGRPFFAGESVAGSDTRTPYSNDLNAAAGTNFGREQMLTVSWSFGDSSSYGTSAWAADKSIVGKDGFWAFIIGKKHLV